MATCLVREGGGEVAVMAHAIRLGLRLLPSYLDHEDADEDDTQYPTANTQTSAHPVVANSSADRNGRNYRNYRANENMKNIDLNTPTSS